MKKIKVGHNIRVINGMDNFTGVVVKLDDYMETVAPKYRELWDAGQIEIATTPFYHPILPLLQ